MTFRGRYKEKIDFEMKNDIVLKKVEDKNHYCTFLYDILTSMTFKSCLYHQYVRLINQMRGR